MPDVSFDPDALLAQQEAAEADDSTDPELIFEKWQNKIDMVIDGGYGDNEASTVIDCTGEEPLIVREGKGMLK